MSSIKYVNAHLMEDQYLEKGRKSFQGARYEEALPSQVVQEYAEEIGTRVPKRISLEELDERNFDNWKSFKDALKEVKHNAFMEDKK